MARVDRPAITIDGDEGRRIHATWSRSGRRLIVRIHKLAWSDDYQQVELTPEQVGQLRTFLSESAPE